MQIIKFRLYLNTDYIVFLIAGWLSNLEFSPTVLEILKLVLVCSLTIGSILIWLHKKEKQNPSKKYLYIVR